jgi:hypothetical protein
MGARVNAWGVFQCSEVGYLAPPSTGIGVNFVFWDYAGSLRFGILSFAESIEDPNELAMRLSSSLEELVAAADLRRVPTS